MAKLSPIESEFDTNEDQVAYDQWFRAKVAASLTDPRPPVSHELAMAEADALIEHAERSAGAT